MDSQGLFFHNRLAEKVSLYLQGGDVKPYHFTQLLLELYRKVGQEPLEDILRKNTLGSLFSTELPDYEALRGLLPEIFAVRQHTLPDFAALLGRSVSLSLAPHRKTRTLTPSPLNHPSSTLGRGAKLGTIAYIRPGFLHLTLEAQSREALKALLKEKSSLEQKIHHALRGLHSGYCVEVRYLDTRAELGKGALGFELGLGRALPSSVTPLGRLEVMTKHCLQERPTPKKRAARKPRAATD